MKKIVVLSFFLLSPFAWSADSATVPGLIQSFTQLLDTEYRNHQQLSIHASKNRKTSIDLARFTTIELNPLFLQSLLVHSPRAAITLFRNNECNLYLALENNLLRTREFPITQVIVDLFENGTYKETAITSLADFIQVMNQKKCQNNATISEQFKLNNVAKTLNTIQLSIPSKTQECLATVENFAQANSAPALCKIAQLMTNETTNKNTERLTQQLTPFQKIYLTQICQNLATPERFCQRYLEKDYWNRVENSEISDQSVKDLCLDLFKRPFTPQTYHLCFEQLKKNKNICHFQGTQSFPTLTPLPACDARTLALNNGRLQTRYHDCPGIVQNEGMITATRVLAHFRQLAHDSTSYNCAALPNDTFLKFLLENQSEKWWNYRICYTSRFTNELNCKIYSFGDLDKSENSEAAVIAAILKENASAPVNLTCRFISSKEYRPFLLDYQKGCYLVYNENNCTSTNCPKKIIYNNRPITDIQYKSGLMFDYFSSSVKNHLYNIPFWLENTLPVENKPIQNFNQLKFYLQQSDETIAHGVGCREDLLPQFFIKQGLNQCTPTAFLIDGIVESNSPVKHYAVVRTGLDDVHAPRIISWRHIFNAVKSYELLHPLQSWTLYAIKKRAQTNP